MAITSEGLPDAQTITATLNELWDAHASLALGKSYAFGDRTYQPQDIDTIERLISQYRDMLVASQDPTAKVSGPVFRRIY